MVEGIGEDIFPSTMDFKVLDDVLQVNDRECFVVARRWSRAKASLLAARAAAAFRLRCASRANCPPGAFVVAFLPDTGMRYLSKVYSDEWMRERGYAETEVPLTAKDVVAAKHRAGKARELIIVRPYQTVFHALRTMQEQDISQLPVFEENISWARFTRTRS